MVDPKNGERRVRSDRLLHGGERESRRHAGVGRPRAGLPLAVFEFTREEDGAVDGLRETSVPASEHDADRLGAVEKGDKIQSQPASKREERWRKRGSERDATNDEL